MVKYKAKIVGLKFHRISTPVEDGDEVFVMAVENDYDADALEVHSFNSEVIGFIANSNTTLLPNNIKRGNKSGTQLKLLLDWENKKYSAKVVHSYRSCIYIEIDGENWQYIDESIVNETDAIINELKVKLEALSIENTMLEARVKALELAINVGK
jgi:hypothetical protein